MRNILLLGMLIFIIGCTNNKKKDYTFGIPPAPPFRDINIIISHSITDGCFQPENNEIGYIISITKDKVSDFDIEIQSETGARRTLYLETDMMSNYDKSWLPEVLIPGNKIDMKVEHCGSGGFTYIMEMKTLQRE